MSGKKSKSGFSFLLSRQRNSVMEMMAAEMHFSTYKLNLSSYSAMRRLASIRKIATMFDLELSNSFLF